MEKTIKWDQAEMAQMQQIEQERTQVLAQIGALMMDLETAKKNLDTTNEKHKTAIRAALTAKGITQFESGRPIPGGIIITVPDRSLMEELSGNKNN